MSSLKIIGHRGAKGLAPENTIAGLKKGLEHGSDELEFDVRVTKDNVVILCHNAHLTDVAGNELKLKDYTYQELKQHKSDLATLDEVFTSIGHTLPLLIEVKPKEPVAPIIAVIRQRLADGWKPEYLLLGSFDQKVLRALHRELPEVEKVVIEHWSGVWAHLRARQVGAKRLNMRSWWIWSGFLVGMSRRGYKIAVYTLDDPVKAHKWLKYGLYGVITDFPDRFEKAHK